VPGFREQRAERAALASAPIVAIFSGAVCAKAANGVAVNSAAAAVPAPRTRNCGGGSRSDEVRHESSLAGTRVRRTNIGPLPAVTHITISP